MKNNADSAVPGSVIKLKYLNQSSNKGVRICLQTEVSGSVVIQRCQDQSPNRSIRISRQTKVAGSVFKQKYPNQSSNRGVEKYLSAVSGRTVTTLFPGPKSSAIRIAAATFVPEEIPHIMPSLEASSLDVSIAS